MYSDGKKNGNLSSKFLRQLAGLVRFCWSTNPVYKTGKGNVR